METGEQEQMEAEERAKIQEEQEHLNELKDMEFEMTADEWRRAADDIERYEGTGPNDRSLANWIRDGAIGFEDSEPINMKFDDGEWTATVKQWVEAQGESQVERIDSAWTTIKATIARAGIDAQHNDFKEGLDQIETWLNQMKEISRG